MSLLVPWIGLPLVLGVLSLGCALAIELASAIRIARALLLPVGLAVVIVVAQALTVVGFTAKLATPVVVALALVGLVLGRRRARRAVGPWLLAALAVYLVYGAPVLASGAATFTGYRTLDDTATWLALIDHVMSHGRDLHGLIPSASSYQATVHQYLLSGYPLGGFVSLGVTQQIMGVDVMWLYQPFLAYAGAMLALALYELVRRLIRRRAVAVAVAAIAAQPATLYGYSMWGGIKEMVAAAMLPLVAGLAGERRAIPSGWRATLPLAVACSALLATLSVGAIVWIVPLVLPALIAGAGVTRRAPWRALRLQDVGWLALLGAVCSVPVILLARTFLAPLFMGGPGAGGVFTSAKEVGTLPHRLDIRQLIGIWPTGDFRTSAVDVGLVDALLVVVVALAATGVVIAWRRGQRALPAYVLGAVVVAVAIHLHSSPWADGKSLAQSSPALLVAALTMAAIGLERPALRRAGWVAGGVLGIAVLWSNVLAYRGASLAPREQLTELQHVAAIADGHGPTLFNDGAVVATRHILRGADAKNPNITVRLRDRTLLPPRAQADIDQFDPAGVWDFRQLVLRRGPDASRPPAAYRLRWSGRYFELWERPAVVTRPLGHLTLGTAEAGGIPRCADIAYGGRAVGPSGSLDTVVRRSPTVVALSSGSIPDGWKPVSYPGAVIPRKSGTIARTVSVASSGRWLVWLLGSTRGRTTLSIDGHVVRSVRDELNWVDRPIPFGGVQLAAGRHRLTLHYDEGGWAPGAVEPMVTPYFFGPVILSQDTADLPVLTVPAARARSLCGRRLDWVELRR